MIFPITLPQWTYSRAGRHRNIVQVVEAHYIAALELHCCGAAGRLKVGEGEGTESRNRIEVFKDHYVVKEDAKSVVWRGAGFHDLIEKAQIVESAGRSDKGLADRVKVGTSRTKECAKRIVGRRHGADAKVTSDRRRCGSPAGEGAGLKIAVNNKVGETWSGSGDEQNTDGEERASKKMRSNLVGRLFVHFDLSSINLNSFRLRMLFWEAPFLLGIWKRVKASCEKYISQYREDSPNHELDPGT